MSTFGEALVKAVSEYLVQNNLKSLGQINSPILKDIADRTHTYYLRQMEQKEQALSDDQWLAGLQKREENQRLNVKQEHLAAQEWYSDPNRKIPLTRDRFRNWLKDARANLPLNTGDSKADKRKIKPNPNIEPSWDWRRFTATRWPKESHERPLYEEMGWFEVKLTVREEILKAYANQT